MSPPWIYQNVYVYRESLPATNRPWIYPEVAAVAINVSVTPNQTSPSNAEESKILEKVQRGHDYYYREKYRAALDEEYIQAQAMILKLVDSSLVTSAFTEDLIARSYLVNMLPTMLEVATEYARLGFDVDQNSQWIKPQFKLTDPNSIASIKNELSVEVPGPLDVIGGILLGVGVALIFVVRLIR
jgi:hypothetical protein